MTNLPIYDKEITEKIVQFVKLLVTKRQVLKLQQVNVVCSLKRNEGMLIITWYHHYPSSFIFFLSNHFLTLFL